MRSHFSEKSEALLCQRVNESLLQKRSELTRAWLFKGGPGYKAAVVLSWIAAAYNLIVFLAQTFGLWLMAADSPLYIADARTITICSGLIAVSIILLVFKKHVLASVATVAFGVFYLINSRSLWLDDVVINTKQITSIYIFIPFTLIALAAALFIIITVAVDKLQFKAEYNRLIDKIIRTYSASGDEVTTEEQWEERIKQYVEPAEHKKPKKSLRAKARKQENEEE